ncbi:MAG TPA: DUF1552 domain-containing protein, partial [Humisphaera sp.]|nr:DUF1552 domain-containing protein [Humisphaera sp.]
MRRYVRRSVAGIVQYDLVRPACREIRSDGGTETRLPSLSLGIPSVFGTHTGSLSWTEQGLPVSPMQSPARVFDLLFGKDDMPADLRLLRLKQRLMERKDRF